MLNTQRINALNLLVRNFLRDRGVADDVCSDWMSADVQRDVLQSIACLCVRPPAASPRWKLQLSFRSGDTANTETVLVNKDMVYLGSNLADLAGVKGAQLVTQPFMNDAGVYGLHLMMKRVSPSAYMISSFAPNMTWVAVGTTSPTSLCDPASARHTPPVVLQPGCAFSVADHVFQVLEAPQLSKNQTNFPAASPVIPRAPVNRPDAVDEFGCDGVCVLECVAPVHSPVFQKLWTLQYMFGNVVFSVGAGEACTITIPAAHLGASVRAQPHHCSIHAVMGCFWLVAKDGPTYYHLYSTTDHAVVTGERPVTMLLGSFTHIDLSMKQV